MSDSVVAQICDLYIVIVLDCDFYKGEAVSSV